MVGCNSSTHSWISCFSRSTSSRGPSAINANKFGSLGRTFFFRSSNARMSRSSCSKRDYFLTRAMVVCVMGFAVFATPFGQNFPLTKSRSSHSHRPSFQPTLSPERTVQPAVAKESGQRLQFEPRFGSSSSYASSDAKRRPGPCLSNRKPRPPCSRERT